jgi:signal transduction histidine kinase
MGQIINDAVDLTKQKKQIEQLDIKIDIAADTPAGRKRGMGLAHAQRLIEINHGTLSLASQPDKGTTVTIVLPCK